jgi:hypothetical protein
VSISIAEPMTDWISNTLKHDAAASAPPAGMSRGIGPRGSNSTRATLGNSTVTSTAPCALTAASKPPRQAATIDGGRR